MATNIFILTGSIQTGKTTALVKWSTANENVFGILTPIVSGKRIFMNAFSKEVFSMEAEPIETDILSIGKYSFSAKSFENANDILHAVQDKNCYCIVDEIGPLELKEQGLCYSIKKILSLKNPIKILVVRAGLVEKVIEFFNLQNATILSIDDIENGNIF
jgi:nucleoside-triphosphatase THEP1